MIQELMPYVCGALQWARARKKFADGWFLLIVAGASFGFYLWSQPNAFSTLPTAWQPFVQGWWEQAKSILATVQIISSASNTYVDMRGNAVAVPKFLPVTDSK